MPRTRPIPTVSRSKAGHERPRGDRYSLPCTCRFADDAKRVGAADSSWNIRLPAILPQPMVRCLGVRNGLGPSVDVRLSPC